MQKLLLVALVAATFTAFGLIGMQPTKTEAATRPLELAFTNICEVRWESPNGDPDRETFDEPSVVLTRYSSEKKEWDQWSLQNSPRKYPVKGYLQLNKC